MEVFSHLLPWNMLQDCKLQHTLRFTTTLTTIPPLLPPVPPTGKHYRHAVTVQVPRAKLSINSRKVVNIQTRESTPIYHKQLHGIRTSFTSSSQSQEAVLLFSCQLSFPLHVNSRRASVYTVTGERFISKLFLARVLVAGGWSTLVEFATTEATTQPHWNATTGDTVELPLLSSFRVEWSHTTLVLIVLIPRTLNSNALG